MIQGTAPAGRVLRITKTITNQTSTRPDDDNPDDGLPAPALKGLSFSEDRTSTMVVPSDGRFTWHVSPSSQPRADQAAWRLTCEDSAGNVLESRDVFVARAQTVDLALTCGTQLSTSGPRGPTCINPDGFRSANVARRGSGLRITFSRKVRNPVTVHVFQTSKGRRIVPDTRVIRFRSRRRSFTWNGRGTKRKRLVSGMYYVRFRVTDANRRVDSRRIVVEKRKGRFTKRGTFILEQRCPR